MAVGEADAVAAAAAGGWNTAASSLFRRRKFCEKGKARRKVEKGRVDDRAGQHELRCSCIYSTGVLHNASIFVASWSQNV